MRAAGLLCVVVVAACARPHVPARPLDRAPAAPAGVARSVGTFSSADGVELFEQCWYPADRAPRAVVVIVHGIKDHSSRYDGWATRLVRADHAACGFDHRGHGRSAGPRFDLHSFDAVLGDIDRYLALVGERFPGAPVFLFGHSMGGVIAPLYVIERRPAIRGLILSAPALHPPVHPFGIAALIATARVLPHAPLLDAPDASFSPDPAVVDGMRRDPLIHHGRGTGRMAAELARGVERVWASVGAIRVPTLILTGDVDRAVDPRGSVELRRRVGSRDVTLRMYRGAGHDLAHDPQRAAIADDIVAWIDAHVPQPTSPVSSTQAQSPHAPRSRQVPSQHW